MGDHSYRGEAYQSSSTKLDKVGTCF